MKARQPMPIVTTQPPIARMRFRASAGVISCHSGPQRPVHIVIAKISTIAAADAIPQ
jgi:hypothetical protein